MLSTIMGLLSSGLSFFAGKGLGPVTVPILAVGLLVSLYHNVQGRRDAAVTKIETAAAAQCNARWLLNISKSKERAALAEAQQAKDLLQGEREINERLANDLNLIRTQHDELRTRLDGVGDKCLSDGVLSALGGREPVRKPASSPGGAAKGKPPGE